MTKRPRMGTVVTVLGVFSLPACEARFPDGVVFRLPGGFLWSLTLRRVLPLIY